MKKHLYLFGFIFLFLGSISAQVTNINGTNYKTVVIGSQTWMAENLSTIKFKNGDFITHAKTIEQWIKAENEGKPAFCYYNNGTDKNSILYNFYAVTDERMLAPEGFKIPSKSDWDNLIKTLGGEDIAGLKLKSISGWKNDGNKSFNGSNESNFNALPVGIRTSNYKYEDGGEFVQFGEECTFWTSTIDNNIYSDGNQSFAYNLNNYSHKVGGFPYSYYMGCGFSVRCIKE
jgi:uncharacterized protein (TIGR02145 family)